MYNHYNDLVGKIIKSIRLSDDNEVIKFDLVDPEFQSEHVLIGVCGGDCCSHTWIEDVIAPEAAIDSIVLEANYLDLPEELQGPTKTANYEEEMGYYGVSVTTAKGVCTIAYRNSSNGYYGGYMSWYSKEPYGKIQWKEPLTSEIL